LLSFLNENTRVRERREGEGKEEEGGEPRTA